MAPIKSEASASSYTETATLQERIKQLETENIQLQTVVDNTLRNFGAKERESELCNRHLQRQVNELTEKLVKTSAEYSPSNREMELREEVTRLKNHVALLKAALEQSRESRVQEATITSQQQDIVRLQNLNAALNRQLQAEKANNLRGMSTAAGKWFDDGDDDEPLPGASAALRPSSQRLIPYRSAPAPAFRTPRDVPDGFFEEFERKQGAEKSTAEHRTHPSKKRKRCSEKEAADDLAGRSSRTVNVPKKVKTPPRKSHLATTTLDNPRFKFYAVCGYTKDGLIDKYFQKKDLKVMTELWERIEICARTVWEDRKGQEWQLDFTHPSHKAKNLLCVTQRCLGARKARWHGKPGQYACKDCAEAGRPCFVFVAGEDAEQCGDFCLLPLAKDDRGKPPTKDCELRYWINDDIEMADDAWTDGTGDEED